MISAETLFVVYDQAVVFGPAEATLQTLRKDWPDIHFTLCSDDDIPARLTPAVEGEAFNLYLVSNIQHCIAFTSEREAATGIVLAATEASDD